MRDTAARDIKPMSVSLAELLDHVPGRAELIRLLTTGFETSLGIELVG